MVRGSRSKRIGLVGGVGLAALGLASGAWAQNVAFNIPAEDAGAALAAWSAASGVAIDAPAALTAGVKTAAVSGEMDSRDALNALIAGTKLVILADDGSKVSLGSVAGDTVSTVTVTATGTNIQGVKAIGSPVQRLTREDLLKTGATSVREALQSLPLIQTAGAIGDIGGIAGVTRNGQDQGSAGPTAAGIQSIDLGGQGSRATLVLVDGQRLAHTGENASFTDVTQIPMSALGAIEVIPDGASAIYGTDAIAGVINFVVRRNYQGVSISADYTKDDFAPAYGGAITIGKAWNWLQGGNVLFSFDSHLQKTAFQNANKYTALDRRPVGGNLTVNATPASDTPYITTNACIATNTTQNALINAGAQVASGGTITTGLISTVATEIIPANSCYDAAAPFSAATGAGSATSGRTINRTVINYGLPPGLNGATPTLAQLVNLATTWPGAGQPGKPLYDPLYVPADSYQNYLNGNKTENLLLSLQQKFSDSIDGNVKFSYSLLSAEVTGYRLNNIGLTPSAVGGINNSTVAANLYPGGPTALAQNSTGTGCLPNTVAIGQACPSVTIIYPYGRIHDLALTAQYQNNAALNVALPYNWTAKWTGNMAASRAGINGGTRDVTALAPAQTATGSSNLRDIYLVNGTLSPYSPAYTSPSFVSLLGGNKGTIYRPAMDTQLVLSGPVYNLPGGAVRLSLAAAANYETNKKTDWTVQDLNSGERILLGPQFSVEARTQNRGTRLTAEIYIPVVGEANAMPGVRNLTLDIAASRSTQSRSRSDSTDPTFSWQYKPINDLTLHGTYSTSFRAPDLSESSSGTDQFAGAIGAGQSIGLTPTELAGILDTVWQNAGVAGSDPATRTANAALAGYDTDPTHYYNGSTPGSTVVALSLATVSKNPFLKPEHSTSITATIDYKPSWLTGLSVTASYRSLDYKDKIQSLAAGNWLVDLARATTYAPYIQPVHLTPGCDPTDPTTYPEEILRLLPDNGTRFASQQTSTSRLCDTKLILVSGNRNITGTTQKTATLQASYRFNTQLGTFSADTNFTKILETTEEISPGHNLTTLLDYIGAANSLRGRSSVGWSKGVWSLTVFANYVGPYTNDQQTTLTNRGVLNSAGTAYTVAPCADRVPVSGGIENATNTNTIGPIPTLTNGAFPGSCKLPIYQVPSWTTFDLSASFRTNADAPYWARNVRIGMNINNITGKAAPYAMNGTNVYDPANSNIRGRIYHFTINKDF